MATTILGEELSCSICLNTYSDPVTLRCGHNFCQGCINRVLDTQEGAGAYSCPDCNQEFQDRLDLLRNITLCSIIRRYTSCLTEEKVEGIFCTYCVSSPVAAVRSCLHCEASLCDQHLIAHSKSPEHVLSKPSNSLQSRKCSIHKKILEYYCTQDALCICVTCCLAGDHKGHKVEQLIEASNKKKETLRTILAKLLAKRAEVQDRVQSLDQRRREEHERATTTTETVSALFGDIRRQLEDLERRILAEISKQEEKVSDLVSALIQKLEIKKDELSGKMSHIERVCDMTDPLTVLKEEESGRDDFCDTEEADNVERQAYNDKVQHMGGVDEGLMKVTLHAGLADIISSVKVGADGEKPSDIALDANTASYLIELCKGDKTIRWDSQGSESPRTPERFQTYPQVLSTRTYSSGKHFLDWELYKPSSGDWGVGMCYPTIDRSGDSSYLGFNTKSWCLHVYKGQCSVIHDSSRVYLPHVPESQRFRMCLDYEAGRLSFYEVCDPIRHLHTFTSTFTEPLHVACYLWGHYVSVTFK
ncbi:E3 ubiquitin/ISG15 ligase TRIM25-like [Engystomops pustulosus]|uniref:E3 ubiquitin/ISG15 ligase TRIM25-like n=1 Tax=Engystomops pustulosus TaxID=76066 RepID=UPI003AFA5890